MLPQPRMEEGHAKGFYLFISSLRRCRCFYWNANKLAHSAVRNEEEQQMHIGDIIPFR